MPMPSARESQAALRANSRKSSHPVPLSASPRLRGESSATRFPASPRRSLTKAGFPLSAFVLFASALLASANNPYTGIVDRNVFSLKDKPVVEEAPKVPPTPPVKLTLTGITTILGNKRALLKGQLPARGQEPAKDESYMLSEGQRQDGIEIVAIDEKAGKVTVNNNGIPETLDFLNNGAKLMAAAPPPTTPGVIPPPPGMPGHPGALGPGGARALPTRNLPNPQHSGSGENAGIGGAGASTPPSSSATAHFSEPITPETQALMIEAQRMQLQQAGREQESSMFPNTELTESLQPQDDQSAF